MTFIDGLGALQATYLISNIVVYKPKEDVVRIWWPYKDLLATPKQMCTTREGQFLNDPETTPVFPTDECADRFLSCCIVDAFIPCKAESKDLCSNCQPNDALISPSAPQ